MRIVLKRNRGPKRKPVLQVNISLFVFLSIHGVFDSQSLVGYRSQIEEPENVVATLKMLGSRIIFFMVVPQH